MARHVETMNKFLVSGRSDGVVIGVLPRGVIKDEDALNLAAYIISVVADDERWAEVLEAVQNT